MSAPVRSGVPHYTAVCEDIMNFMFATASARESMGNLLSRKADLLAQTALARHRTIGGHALGSRMTLRQRQFLRQLGAGSKEHLVLCQKGSVEKRKEFGQLENVVWCQNRIVEKRKEFRQLENVPGPCEGRGKV